MKKILAAMALTLSVVPALAQHHGHRHGNWHQHRPYWHHNHGWVVPALIGGAIVYIATRQDPVVVPQPPVIVQTPPIVVQNPPAVIWIDGVSYTRQIMIINGVHQEVLVKN